MKIKFALIYNFVLLLSLCLSTSVFAEATGNRYNLPRDYTGEVSSAKAYLLAVANEDDDKRHGDRKHHKHHNKDDNDVIIIDVRTVEEHVAGHPEDSFNIPYPHIQGRPNRTEPVYIGQNPKDFYDYVAAQFPDRDTPILTLCRTGFRSVLAANILANPAEWVPEYKAAKEAGMDVPAGYTNVRNIWEGFIGNYKTFTDPNDGVTYDLDLDNDGAITDVDRDGWANYQGLPVSLEIEDDRIYQPYSYLYPGL
jgi:rhodanese-related sulfurtransferase